MSDVPIRLRRAARLLVIDEQDRLLLFDTTLAYTHVWLTPGGGLNHDENYEEGARRELWEETGLRVDDVGPCVWTVNFAFRYEDLIYDQREQYFVIRVPTLDLDDANWEAAERNEIASHRWWSLAEIAASTEQFRPEGLADLLAPILAGNYPEAPIEAHVESGAQTVNLIP